MLKSDFTTSEGGLQTWLLITVLLLKYLNSMKNLKKKWPKSSIDDDIKTKYLKADALLPSLPATRQCVLSDPAQLVRLVQMRLCHKNGLDHKVNEGIPQWTGNIRVQV